MHLALSTLSSKYTILTHLANTFSEHSSSRSCIFPFVCLRKHFWQTLQCIKKHGVFSSPVRMLPYLKKNWSWERREFSYLQTSPLNAEINDSEATHILLHKYSGVKVELLIWVPLALIQPRPFNDVFNFKEVNVTFSWETFFAIILQLSNETIFPI